MLGLPQLLCRRTGAALIEDKTSVDIAKLSHTLNPVDAKEATCSAEGNIAFYSCDVCGHLFSDNGGEHELTHDEAYTPADPAAHKWGDWQIERETGCDAEGEEKRYCELDSSHYDTRPIPTIAHTVNAVEAKQTSCAEKGNIAYWECLVCHTYFSDAEGNTVIEDKSSVDIAKLDHTFTHFEAVTATCRAKGNSEYWECSVCGNYYSDAQGDTLIEDKNSVVIAKLAHSYTDGVCTVCGFKQPTEGLYYGIGVDNKTAFVMRTGNITGTEVAIADEYEGYPVTGISDSVFENCSDLTSITIPYSVTTIGKNAFINYSGLTDLTIPDGVTSIGEKAFMNCTGLTSINIPEGVTAIADYTFDGCSRLTNVNIPEGVTSIGEQAFYNCSELTGITIPDSVKEIGYRAFDGCSKLTTITIPEGVTDIGQSVFEGCSNLETVNWNAKACTVESYYESSTFKNCPKLTTIIIGDNVTAIPSFMFSLCLSLKNVTIGSKVVSIGEKAFGGCTGLASITIPDGVTSIGENVFYNCSGLTNITVGENNTAYASQDGILYNKAKTQFVHIPQAIKGEITISGGVQSIAENEFRKLNGLTGVTFSNGVTSIGAWAFGECSELISVTIPDSITDIASNAFNSCDKLTKVHINDVAKWCNISFGNEYANPLNRAHNLYINGELVTQLVIPEGVTAIGNNAFYGCSGLTGITLPDSLKSIGNYAFYGCSGLTNIDIPNGVTSIGRYAFCYCSELTGITIPQSVTSIATGTFNNCSKLAEITIYDTMSSIDEYAVYECRELTNIDYKGTVDQWKAITKADRWNDSTNYFTISCTNGKLDRYGNATTFFFFFDITGRRTFCKRAPPFCSSTARCDF